MQVSSRRVRPLGASAAANNPLCPNGSHELHHEYTSCENAENQNPREVALLYQLIRDSMNNGEHKRKICPSLEELPSPGAERAKRKIVRDPE